MAFAALLGALCLGPVARSVDAPLWQAGASDAGVAPALADMIARARPAVAAVWTAGSGSGVELPAALPAPDPRRAEGIGSGFVIRSDGYLVTNHHVIEDATAIWVQFEGDSRRWPARVVGSEARYDLALLKVEPERPLPVLPLGDSDDLRVGSWVVAIGNPLGLACVATRGIVSGKGRALGELARQPAGGFDFIQTDAAIDRGNSGGPLLNLRGEVVGINTAINARARGIGFAVPIDLAKAVLPQLAHSGRLTRSYLGITIDGLDWDLAHSLGLESKAGVVITEVRPESPAERAGLRPGDVVLRFDGASISGPPDMGWRAATRPIGQPVAIEVFRAGTRTSLSVIPKPRPDAKPPPAAAPATAGEPDPALGLEVVELDSAAATAAGLPPQTRGLVVVGATGAAFAHGLRIGDVISEVSGRPVASREEWDRVLADLRPGQVARFYVLRQRGALFVALPWRW